MCHDTDVQEGIQGDGGDVDISRFSQGGETAVEVQGIQTEAAANVEPDIQCRVEDLLVGMSDASSYIEPNHNSTIGRDKRIYVRPVREGSFGGRGGNDMLGMAGGILAGAFIADMLF